MRLIPPELTTAILTAISIGGAWFATWLARRGKKEDTRISERGQAFDQLLDLAASRLTEITRLAAERDAANIEKERLETYWEGRVDRQNTRCRKTTDSLAHAIDVLRVKPGPEAEQEASEVLRRLEEHNQDDHDRDD